MANRFYRRSPYDIGLYVPPVEVIAQTMALAQQKYDTNYALAESLKNQYIPSLPQDRAEANALQEKWNKSIDETVATYNGDYSKAGRGLQKLMSTIKQDISYGGKGHAIVTNYSNYQNWLKESQDRIAKGNVLAEDLNAANQYHMSRYQGVGELDPITGTYNQFNPETLADYQDPNKIIQDTYKEFKPEKRSVGQTVLKNGIFDYSYQEVEGIDANRLYPSFATALENDPKYVTYAHQIAKYRGLSPEQVKDWNLNYSQQRAKDLSYWNTATDNKMERDPLAVAREKARLDKDNMKELMGSLLQYNNDAPNVANSIEPRINPDDWRSSTSAGEVPAATPAGLAVSPLLTMFLPGTTKIAAPTSTLDNFLNTPENDKKLTAKNVIPDLARAMWNKKKSDFASEYNSKYGKDSKWTKEFERNFWYDYKKEWPNQTAFKSYSFEVPEPAKESALRMLPDALNGNASTYIPGEGIQQNGIPSKYRDALFTKDGKLKTDQISVKYAVPSAGYTAAGFEISTPEGKFVIVDPNYQRSIWSKRLAGGLNPIFQEGKSRGANSIPYQNLGVDAKTGDQLFALGVPHVKYEWDGSKFAQSIYMYESNNTPILDKQGNPIRVTMPQIMDASLPLFSESLGFGQSKSDATPFMYFMSQFAKQ